MDFPWKSPLIITGGWPTPLKNGVRQLGWWLFPTEWKNKSHVPNQQPVLNHQPHQPSLTIITHHYITINHHENHHELPIQSIETLRSCSRPRGRSGRCWFRHEDPRWLRSYRNRPSFALGQNKTRFVEGKNLTGNHPRCFRCIWNIYQHLPQKWASHVGKYSSTMVSIWACFLTLKYI